MPTPPSGWYADPAGSEQYRWWDGTTWTDALSPSSHARPPVDAAAAGPEPSERLIEDAPNSAESAAPSSAPEILQAGPSNHSRGLRPLAVVVVLALVCVGALGLGTSVFGSTRLGTDRKAGSTPAAQTPTPTSPTSASSPLSASSPSPGVASMPPGWVNQVTGDARIGDAAMTLPGDPYQIAPDAFQDSVFDAAFFANAPVHPAYSGSNSWFATVAMLHVPADQAQDPAAASEKAMQTTLKWFFGNADRTVQNPRSEAITIADNRPAVRLSAEVWYDIQGLASTHDDLTFVIAALPDGSYVAAVSSVPNDAPKVQRTLAATSLASLTVR